MSKHNSSLDLPTANLVRDLLSTFLAHVRRRANAPSRHPLSEPGAEIVAQYHAAEYAAERNSVDVWKTLQYALIPIMFVVWSLLVQIRDALNSAFFCWACAAVLPVCYVAYQKAMVDALTGVLLIEARVRPLAIKLAGTDKFWFHEPVYRKRVPPDFAYGWYWPPLFSFCSVFAGLLYRVIADWPFSSPDWWRLAIDLAGFGICFGVAWFVQHLSKQGLDLNRKIDVAIQRNRLSWLKH